MQSKLGALHVAHPSFLPMGRSHLQADQHDQERLAPSDRARNRMASHRDSLRQHTEILERNRMLSTAVCRITLKAWDANPPSFATSGEPTFVQTLRRYASQSEKKRQRSVYSGGAPGSTETTTPVGPSPSSDLKALEQVRMGSILVWTPISRLISADFMFGTS